LNTPFHSSRHEPVRDLPSGTRPRSARCRRVGTTTHSHFTNVTRTASSCLVLDAAHGVARLTYATVGFARSALTTDDVCCAVSCSVATRAYPVERLLYRRSRRLDAVYTVAVHGFVVCTADFPPPHAYRVSPLAVCCCTRPSLSGQRVWCVFLARFGFRHFRVLFSPSFARRVNATNCAFAATHPAAHGYWTFTRYAS